MYWVTIFYQSDQHNLWIHCKNISGPKSCQNPDYPAPNGYSWILIPWICVQLINGKESFPWKIIHLNSGIVSCPDKEHSPEIKWIDIQGRDSFPRFPFHISGRGGERSPPYGGGLSPEGGGMARDSFATN